MSPTTQASGEDGMADFLDGMFKTEDAPETVVDDVATPTEPVAEPEPQGDPEPAPAEDPAPAPQPEPEAPKDDQRTIPLATALNWRDEARELKRWKEQHEAQTRQPAATPNPYDDPEGYQAAVDQRVQSMMWNQTVNISAQFAERQYGKSDVEAAMEWAADRLNGDPAFQLQARQQTSPVEWIVQQHKREALLSDIGDRDVDTFVRDYLAKNPDKFASSAPVAAAPVAAPVPPAPKPAVPPRSIASDATPSSSAPTDPTAFWSFLDRK